jgi:predicted Fe-Mo cluster-binding NifX family protein
VADAGAKRAFPAARVVQAGRDERSHRAKQREECGVRVAITAAGPDLASRVDQRFGRARYLLVVDTPDTVVAAVDNKAGMDATQGAGVQAAQHVIDNNASILITGHCGPKAFRALKAGGVHVYLAPDGTVGETIEAFRAGDLKHSSAPDVDGHW